MDIYEKPSKEQERAMDNAMVLMLTLPLEVLMDFYFDEDELREFMPGFCEKILKYYDDWKKGDLMMSEMKKNLWTYAGIRMDICEKGCEFVDTFKNKSGQKN